MRFERIEVDPKTCSGKARVKGTRITAEFVLKLMGGGKSAQEIVNDYPNLEPQDVYACAAYGSWLASGEHYDLY